MPSKPIAQEAEEIAAEVDVEEHKLNVDVAQQALSAEFHALIRDTEKLLKHTASAAGSQADELREQIRANLVRARDTLKTQEQYLIDQSRVAVQATEDYIITNPLKAVGIAAGVGFLVGVLVGRR